MREAGKKLTDVTDVYISRAHADHRLISIGSFALGINTFLR